MPVGQREKSFRSRPCQSSMLTLVTRAMVSSEMPRRSRSLRSRGPNVSLSDMEDFYLQQFVRRTNFTVSRFDSVNGSALRARLVITVTERYTLACAYDEMVHWCLSFHAAYRCRHSGACCRASWSIPFT